MSDHALYVFGEVPFSCLHFTGISNWLVMTYVLCTCMLLTLQVNGMAALPQVRESAEQGADADEDWSVDTSADAVKQRQTTLSMAAASLAITDDLELSEDDRLERLYSFVEGERVKDNLRPANRTVFEEAKRLEVLDKGVFIVCEILFDETVTKQLQEYRRFLLQVWKWTEIGQLKYHRNASNSIYWVIPERHIQLRHAGIIVRIA